jgi:hypothetical protein
MKRNILTTIVAIIIVAISASNVKLSKSSTEENLSLKRKTPLSYADYKSRECVKSEDDVKSSGSSMTSYQICGTNSNYCGKDKRGKLEDDADTDVCSYWEN